MNIFAAMRQISSQRFAGQFRCGPHAGNEMDGASPKMSALLTFRRRAISCLSVHSLSRGGALRRRIVAGPGH
jgi:hypothetical protein